MAVSIRLPLSNYELQYIAHCYQLKGDYAQAISLYERALEVHQQAGLLRFVVMLLDAQFGAGADIENGPVIERQADPATPGSRG